MRLLADESVDFPIIQLLRHNRFDIRSVSEEFAGKDDEFVLSLANEDSRILITSDKDFGELVYRLRRVSKGVILLRIEELLPVDKAALVLKVVQERGEELSGSFTVIGNAMVRVRRVE
jgi:predicted nuclease of predicted toxin-antitoxin system